MKKRGLTIGEMASGKGGAIIGGLLGALFFGDSHTDSQEAKDMKRFVKRSKVYHKRKKKKQ